MTAAVDELLAGTGWAFDEQSTVTRVQPYHPWAPVWTVGAVDAHLHHNGWDCWIEPDETTITVKGPRDA